jgi:hypothetical protein
VQDLLKDFGVCHQALSGSNQTLQEELTLIFVRVRSADEVHRDIGVDKDQA